MSTTLPWWLSRLKPELMHSTFIPPPFTPAPHILTLVCFSMLDHPEFCPRAIRIRLRALTTLGVRLRMLLCISTRVRERFAERFGISRERMPLVPPGAPAASSVRNRRRSCLRDLGKVPVTEPPLLYGGAQALVYASFYESFGMPKAMASGTPVITSKTSAMPETAVGAAALVHPYRFASIEEGMHKIAADDSLRDSLRERGLAHAAAFTWDATARGTLAAYRQVAAWPGQVYQYKSTDPAVHSEAVWTE